MFNITNKIVSFVLFLFLFFSLCPNKIIIRDHNLNNQISFNNVKNTNNKSLNFKPIRFEYNELEFNLDNPGDAAKISLNFSFHPEDWKPYSDKFPISFELDYTYFDKNGSIRKDFFGCSSGTLVFYIPDSYFNNEFLNIYTDLHIYFYSWLDKKEYHLFPKIRTYNLNLSKFTSLRNVNISKKKNNQGIFLPYKFHFDNQNNKLIIDEKVEILFRYEFDNSPYFLISNYKIIFLSDKLSIANFIIKVSKEFIYNLANADFNQMGIDTIINGNEISFIQTNETYFNPLTRKICIGHSNIFGSILGIYIDPFIENNNLDFQFPIVISLYFDYKVILNMNIENYTPISLDEIGKFICHLPNYLSKLWFHKHNGQDIGYDDLR